MLGCDGGFTQQVYDYTKKYSGCTSTKSYSYKQEVRESCNQSKKPRVPNTIAKKYYSVQAGESSMMNYLFNKGPLSVSMRIYPSFQKIPVGSKDVYRSKAGEEMTGTHSVTLVGYGTSSKNEKYWIIKVGSLILWEFKLNFVLISEFLGEFLC